MAAPKITPESNQIENVEVLDVSQYFVKPSIGETEVSPRVNNLDEIILHLKKIYPYRNYTPEQQLSYIMFDSGQQSIITYLVQLQKDIAEQHFSTVS